MADMEVNMVADMESNIFKLKLAHHLSFASLSFWHGCILTCVRKWMGRMYLVLLEYVICHIVFTISTIQGVQELR